jgi:phytoene synthase
MEQDLQKTTYQTVQQTEQYMYGSAEVVGLMMARILALPDDAYHYARLLGKAMQYINFIRDIEEDILLGRTYLPQEDLQKFDLDLLSEEEAYKKPDAFCAFIDYQIERYTTWQSEAEEGFSVIPRRYRIPIQTASNMYRWTASEIGKDPFVVIPISLKYNLL